MTDKEVTQAAELLAKLEPGYLPQELFMQFTRLSTSAIIELLPFRQNNGQLELLFLQRPAQDPVWPSECHTPGTLIRPTDSSYDDALARIFKDELGQEPTKPVFLFPMLHQSGRGNESALVYACLLADAPKTGTFYDVTQLPENIVKSQLDFIPKAIAAFKKSL